MDAQLVEWVKVIGLSGVFLWQLQVIYRDGKEERARMLAMLEEALEEMGSIKNRLYRLETEFNIFDPPTKPKRPWQLPDEVSKPGA